MKPVKDFIHHLFIPRHSNNYKAKALHIDFLTYYLVFALLFTALVKHLPNNPGDVLGFATDISVSKLFELTNQQREANGLPDLKYNDKLSNAAYKKAQDMFAQGYWAHFAPNGNTPWQFIIAEGYQYDVAGENLAKNFMDSAGVVQAWMNSPSHRENMLRKEYVDVGYAVANGNLAGEDTTLVVQMFGKPLAIADTTQQQNEQTQPVPVAPTTVPITKVLQVTTAPAVLAQPHVPVALPEPAPKLNLFPMFFKADLIFLLFLALALILDFYFTKKLNVLRVSGKNIAHLMFIIFIFIGAIIMSKGSIF